MSDPFGGGGEGNLKKADGVADAINKLLQDLTLKCAKEEGIRDYFHISVIGYGAQTGPAFAGALTGRQLVPISDVGNSPASVEQRSKKISDGAGGIVEQQVRFPVWFSPVANGGTPMCDAIRQARQMLEGWLTQHPRSFPPIVINITDGEATDGDPTAPADELRKLRSDDGEVLLFNLHLSSNRSAPVIFPNVEDGLPDQFARQLFQMSSILPAYMVNIARKEGLSVSEGCRGFVFTKQSFG